MGINFDSFSEGGFYALVVFRVIGDTHHAKKKGLLLTSVFWYTQGKNNLLNCKKN
jgi:hypothetical protein